MKKGFFYFFIASFFLSGCKDAYNPDIAKTRTSYLVVEGLLNIDGPTRIVLTRTTQLDTVNMVYESGALITVEGSNNNMVGTLNSVGNGAYVSSNLNLLAGEQYRVRIKTTGNKEYLSEYVIAKRSPAIDSVSWKRRNGGVEISVSTHDATAQSKFYKWEFDETWEVRAYYESKHIYVNGIVRERAPHEMVYRGWKDNFSKQINIAASTNLEADVIDNKPLFYINPGSERLDVRYSILVRQHVIDENAYKFYQVMKKNTESLGTIFDPLPSELSGNIKCITDLSEPVIGYISASSVTEKRMFINKTEVDDWRYFQYCPSIDIPNHPDSLRAAFDAGANIPIEALLSESNPNIIIGYMSSSAICGDCTRRGAYLLKPTFW